jgi:hypothetical protein
MRKKSRPWLASIAKAVLVGALALPAYGQYVGAPAKKTDDSLQPKLRSTAILEWIGEPGKPGASRIVPIAVFDGTRYQDGGLYLRQPEPLAVEDGTEYELQKAGVPQGNFVILQAAEVQQDWFGYGIWHPMAPPKVAKLKPSKTPPRVVTEANADRPALKNKTGAAASSTDSSPSGKAGTAPAASTTPPAPASTAPPDTTPEDPDRPALHRRTAADASDSSTDTSSGQSTTSTSDTSQQDPDRPTLHRKSDASSSDSASGAGTGDVDPDRPTLHKRSVTAAAAGTGERDPDRPTLHRGPPAASDFALAASKLTGMPAGLQQMAAVSDSTHTADHPFAYQWASPDDAAKMQAALEDIARKAILASGGPIAPAAAKPAPVHRTTRTGAARKKVAPPPLPLADEQFKAYELSYSGGATLILTAKTGEGDAEKDVTVIAQPDFYGVPHVVLQSVTDAAHLDMTPRMRLIDAVDTDGDNRAELIFELRNATDRQFAIYKVAGGKAEQVFASASLPLNSNEATTD